MQSDIELDSPRLFFQPENVNCYGNVITEIVRKSPPLEWLNGPKGKLVYDGLEEEEFMDLITRQVLFKEECGFIEHPLFQNGVPIKDTDDAWIVHFSPPLALQHRYKPLIGNARFIVVPKPSLLWCRKDMRVLHYRVEAAEAG